MMKGTIKKLEFELALIDQRKKDIQKAIDALQKICNHNWEAAGHTHKEIEKCSECGLMVSL